MKILALDLATTTGWAHTDFDGGAEKFTPRRGDSPGMKWLRFRAWLLEVLQLVGKVDVIVYEQAHHRGGAATHSAHGFIATLEAVAAEKGIEVTNYHTASIKKHATGSGNASKDAMVAAAKERWSNVDDDNHADALWLLDLAQSELT